MTWEHVSPHLKRITIGGLIAGIIFGLLGIVLIILGASGDTEFKFFGQTFKSANVGIAAIFLGAAVFVLTTRNVTKTVRHTTNAKRRRR